jgi:hypothetical protein
MKWLVLVLTVFVSVPARADIEIEEQMDIAKAQLGAGVALTIVAAVLGATGGGVLATHASTDEAIAKQGALGLGAGAAVLAVIGIPLAVVGGQRLRDLKKRQLAVGVSSVKLSF